MKMSKKALFYHSLVLICLLPACGGRKKAKQLAQNNEIKQLQMPLALQGDAQTYLFDEDIEAFVLDDESASEFNISAFHVADNEQDLDFEWDEIETKENSSLVYFPYDGRDPRQDQQENLAKTDELALNAYKNNQKIAIKGHSCKWHGTAAYNLALSQDRALRLKEHFVNDLNIPESSIKSFGVGSEEPIAFEYSIQGQAPNRRVEVAAIA